MQQHRAVAPAETVQEAALAIFYHPALLTNTPLLSCQRDLLDAIWSFLFTSSGQRGPKNPQTQIKMGRDEEHQLLCPTG